LLDAVRQREWLFEALQDCEGLEVFPSQANYLLFRVADAGQLWRDLLDDYAIYIRKPGAEPGLDDCLRVTVGSAEQNARFVAALREILARRIRVSEEEA
jgi:histidinol-phosphate aminotransferase